LRLLEHLLTDAKGNPEALENLVEDILKKREDAKLNKRTILFDAMYDYGVYGENSPFRNILPGAELKELTSEELINIIKKISNYKHRILYYGPLAKSELKEMLFRYHKLPDSLQEIPEEKKYQQLPTLRNKIYVCDYDMKQAEIIMLSKSVPYNRSNIGVCRLFNEYYGGSFSSVVFQTLRESRALAYSVWGAYQSPGRPERAHYIFSYIGTQVDKLEEALDGMFDLLNNMPESRKLLDDSKDAIIKQLQTERITKESIIWRYVYDKRMGNDYKDYRIDIYEQVPEMTMKDLAGFFSKYIKGKKYTILVLGDVDKLDFSVLRKYGKVEQLGLEEVFGY